jgi:hypothetical protein
MKVRSSFVSNSSSSSYAILGVGHTEFIEGIYDELGLTEQEAEDPDICYKRLLDFGFRELDYGIYLKDNLTVAGISWCGIACVGLDLSRIALDNYGDLTLNQIKEAVREAIENEFGIRVDIADIGVYSGESGG